MAFFNGEIGFEEELLVVGQLDHDRHVKDILQPSRHTKT